MNMFRVAFSAFFLCFFGLSIRSVCCDDGLWCPQHQGSDPNGVNDRVKKLASQEVYYTEDVDYKYRISICAKRGDETKAVQQHGKKWPDENKWTTVGQYRGAHVTGGTNWLMIKYFHGDRYVHHCSGVERVAVVLITCDPGVQRGSIKVIEAYRNSSAKDDPLECYYLFELNNDAACSITPKHLSPGFIILIILVVLETVYIILGFIYQRFVVQAKGLEQCGGCDFTRCCQRSSKAADNFTADDSNNMPVLL